ncbi:hypothetical protein LCGC14_3023400 [marine sediment metagenome]|uniref:Uncharacterized protein n=1 Tax=marine sediment metagenome TaxID=412755 RepID=A0A0F8Z289_9ZZZZ
MAEQHQIDDAKQFLQKMQKLSVLEQKGYVQEINNAFRLFWRSRPTIEEFSKYIGGLLITPEILFIMVKGGY